MSIDYQNAIFDIRQYLANERRNDYGLPLLLDSVESEPDLIWCAPGQVDSDDYTL